MSARLERRMAALVPSAVFSRTKKAFGFGVNIHRFRHAAASFWSIHDPANVRGAKDLLGHASFGTTEKRYIMAQSRLAALEPATPAVPTATEKNQHNDEDYKKCCRVHAVLLARLPTEAAPILYSRNSVIPLSGKRE
jgi:hypothetical protein